MDARGEDDSLDFEEDQAERLSAARATMAAETRATIARISQQRAESIQRREHQRARDLTLKIVAAHSKLGNLLAGDWGDFDETGAVAEFRAAIGLDPANTDAHFYLGYLFTEMGDAVGAEAEFRAVLSLDPKHVGADLHLHGLLRTVEVYGTCCWRKIQAADRGEAAAANTIEAVADRGVARL